MPFVHTVAVGSQGSPEYWKPALSQAMKRSNSRGRMADFLRRYRLHLIAVVAAALLIFFIVRRSDEDVEFVGFSGILRARAGEFPFTRNAYREVQCTWI